MDIMAARQLEARMTQPDTTGGPAARDDDAPSAVSVLYRILANSLEVGEVGEVGEVERIGCTELPEGGMSCGLSVALADGQQMLVDVQEH
jgi:hypothetical protein